MDGLGERKTCNRRCQKQHCARFRERVGAVVVVEVQGRDWSRRLNLDVVTRDDTLYGREHNGSDSREGRTGQEKRIVLPLPYLSSERDLNT